MNRSGRLTCLVRETVRFSSLMKLTAAFKQEGDWIAAWIVEMPNVVSQGKTMKEAMDNLRDAYELMVEFYRKEAESQGVTTKDLVLA